MCISFDVTSLYNEDLRSDGLDFLNPNSWVPSNHEHRIYGTDDLSVYAIVDDVDYSWAVQWRWSIHSLKRSSDSPRRQIYLRRSTTETVGEEGEPYESPISGRLVRNRKRIQRNLFLHTAIMDRMGIVRPSPAHIVDHKNRRTLDCRRKNLRWFTPKENSNNRTYTQRDLPKIMDQIDGGAKLGLEL